MRARQQESSLTIAALIPAAPFCLGASTFPTNADESPIALFPATVSEAELAPDESITFQKGKAVKTSTSASTTSAALEKDTEDLVRAPHLIEARAEKGSVQIYNNCGDTEPQRIKVPIAYSGDSECKSVHPETRTHIAPAMGKIDGVYLC